MRRGAALLLALLAACAGAPEPDARPTVTAPPPPPIPQFGAGGLATQDCFPRRARTRGVPGFVPVPAPVVLQGPDDYAGPYAGGRRIAGRGFAYEVSSPVGLVAGFYSACLDAYATEIEWRALPAQEGDALFRIPQPGRQAVVVLIADNPDGPTAVAIFTDYTLRAVPPPASSPGTPSPGG